MNTGRWIGCVVIAFLGYWVSLSSVGPGWHFINNVPVTGVYLALVMPAMGGFLITMAAAMLAPSHKILVASVMVPIVSFASFCLALVTLLFSDHPSPGEVVTVLWGLMSRFMIAAAAGAAFAVAFQSWRLRETKRTWIKGK